MNMMSVPAHLPRHIEEEWFGGRDGRHHRNTVSSSQSERRAQRSSVVIKLEYIVRHDCLSQKRGMSILSRFSLDWQDRLRKRQRTAKSSRHFFTRSPLNLPEKSPHEVDFFSEAGQPFPAGLPSYALPLAFPPLMTAVSLRTLVLLVGLVLSSVLLRAHSVCISCLYGHGSLPPSYVHLHARSRPNTDRAVSFLLTLTNDASL